MKRMDGVVIAVVKEIDAKGGRLKVEYPWMGSAVRSGWAPVASILAGKDRGAFFMPEVDDEVLVAFEHGDFDHPFIVGFLWNGVDQPPETTNKNRIFKTPGGHQLRFEDAGAKKILVKSNGGLEIVLDDGGDFIELRGGGRRITMKSGQVQIT
jgi:uncharacterized protein involved in type VI secretion and phage assembly